MDAKVIEKYRKIRCEHPFMRALNALRWAKTPDASKDWQESSYADPSWEREIDGFKVTLTPEDESVFPIPDKHGHTDYGTYVDEVNRDYNYEWEGNWPAPRVSAPLGLPYTAIRYSGPGWVQGDMNGGYFIPDGIEEEYEANRRHGQSKSVAWQLTREWVEEQLTMLFCSPLTNTVVWVKVFKNDVELASTCMGTDLSGDDEGRDYIFQMVEEHGMVDEAINAARKTITSLTD